MVLKLLWAICMHLFSLAFTLTVYSLYHMQYLQMQMIKPKLKVVIKQFPQYWHAIISWKGSMHSSNLLPVLCNFHFQLVYISGSGWNLVLQLSTRDLVLFLGFDLWEEKVRNTRKNIYSGVSSFPMPADLAEFVFPHLYLGN